MKQKEMYVAPMTLRSTIELEANLCASVITDNTNAGILKTTGHEINYIDLESGDFNGFNETEWE